jgi:hypothetical protein
MSDPHRRGPRQATAELTPPSSAAFIDHFAFQCGYCTAGFLNEGQVLLERLQRTPVARAELETVILDALDGHLCRCTGYIKYHQAVRDVILADPNAIGTCQQVSPRAKTIGNPVPLRDLPGAAWPPAARATPGCRATPRRSSASRTRSPRRRALPGSPNVEQRSAAIFTELGKVLTRSALPQLPPRRGHRPSRAISCRLHQPPVFARCRWPRARTPCAARSATSTANFDPGRVPGHVPEWLLAPREMGMAGQDLAEICVAAPRPRTQWRRQGRGPDLVHHIGDDTLVGWAWHPGYGRSPAPGTQARGQGALVEAWVEHRRRLP